MMRRIWVALGAAAMAIGAGCASAQMTADYPPDYPFGANGTPAHPDGYDGYPGDHPNNQNAPGGGSGGAGWGSGNGGKGGDGVNGGNGGNGGNSGPDGGKGGNGGSGGSKASGGGGQGGEGGDGVGGGGDGGDGGNGTSVGGDGGDGGKGTGPGADGGDGGNGGAASDRNGTGGDGGDGGRTLTTTDSGVGGNGGNGGGAELFNGFGGQAGVGPGGSGERGKDGPRTDPRFQAMLPLSIQRNGVVNVRLAAQDGQMTPQEYAESIQWEDIPGDEIDWGEISVTWYFQDPDDILTIVGGLHPDSLELERIRVIVEYRETGEAPVLDVTFGVGTMVASNKPIIGDPGWKGAVFTVVRPDGGPLGAFLDEFTYRTRDVEIRRFEIVDLGPIGDLNLDGQSDGHDLAVVGDNYGAAGVLQVEEGDANADGSVDTTDATIVVEDAAGG